MHTVYIYKSEVNILISMTPDLQSCKEDHNQDICYLPILLPGKEKLGEACLRALLVLNWFIVMVTVTWLGRYWNNIFIDNVSLFKWPKGRGLNIFFISTVWEISSFVVLLLYVFSVTVLFVYFVCMDSVVDGTTDNLWPILNLILIFLPEMKKIQTSFAIITIKKNSNCNELFYFSFLT